MPEFDGPGLYDIMAIILHIISFFCFMFFIVYIFCKAFATSPKWGLISLLFPVGYIIFIIFKWKHAWKAVAALAISLCIMIWSFSEYYGSGLDSIVEDVKEAGVENLENEARKLLASETQTKLLAPDQYPDAIAKLSPYKVYVYKDRKQITLILKRFNGTTGSGVYISFEHDLDSWPEGPLFKRISNHIVAYRVWE